MRAADEAGLPQADDYTGHSLRPGHVMQASMAGAPDAAIQAQSAARATGRFGSTSARRSFWKTPPAPIWDSHLGL